jgi:hypothetical protein
MSQTGQRDAQGAVRCVIAPEGPAPTSQQRIRSSPMGHRQQQRQTVGPVHRLARKSDVPKDSKTPALRNAGEIQFQPTTIEILSSAHANGAHIPPTATFPLSCITHLPSKHIHITSSVRGRGITRLPLILPDAKGGNHRRMTQSWRSRLCDASGDLDGSGGRSCGWHRATSACVSTRYLLAFNQTCLTLHRRLQGYQTLTLRDNVHSFLDNATKI